MSKNKTTGKRKRTDDPFTSSVKMLKCGKAMRTPRSILSIHRKNGSKPSNKEMYVMESAMEHVESLQRNVATQLCPAGADAVWLLSRENTDARRAAYGKGSRSSHTKYRSPTSVLSEELSKFNSENKENIVRNARSSRGSNKPIRLTSSAKDENEFPMPADGLEFGVEEAMEHLRQAKHRYPLIMYWLENGWIPVSQRTCYRMYKAYVAFKDDGVGKLPAEWNRVRGRPPLTGGDAFIAACLELEDDKHMEMILLRF